MDGINLVLRRRGRAGEIIDRAHLFADLDGHDDVMLDQAKAPRGVQMRDICPVACREIVDGDCARATCDQPGAQMRAEKSCPPVTIVTASGARAMKAGRFMAADVTGIGKIDIACLLTFWALGRLVMPALALAKARPYALLGARIVT